MAKSEASNYVAPIYKERALKHLVMLAGGKKKIANLSPDQYKKMMRARDKIAYDMQFNQLKWVVACMLIVLAKKGRESGR